MPNTDQLSDQPWIVHCDGTALPNPGRIGLGAVLVAPDGERHQISLAPGLNGCNNEAEARALIAALRELHRLGARIVHIHCDSSVLVEQLGAAPAAPVARLAHVFNEARALLGLFSAVQLRWIPSHRNAEADALARAALGLGARQAARRR
jgi:ribonuclease HI